MFLESHTDVSKSIHAVTVFAARIAVTTAAGFASARSTAAAINNPLKDCTRDCLQQKNN